MYFDPPESPFEQCPDPTYDKETIEANPVWKAAFWLSERKNDNAPIGWSKYIPEAEALLLKENPPLNQWESHV